MIPRSFFRRLTAALGLLGLIAILHTTFQSTLQHRTFQAGPLPKATVIPFPPDYDVALPPQSDYCTDRFSVKYLEDLRDNAAEYCEPGSQSSFTCFHSHRAEHGKADSMCIGRGATFDSSGEFKLDCTVRQLSPEEVARGLVPLKSIRDYWYNTGPAKVVSEAVRFLSSEAGAGPEAEVEPQGLSVAGAGAGAGASPRFYILLKREGSANTWHSLMEIWSCWLSLDVLRMAGHSPLDHNNKSSTPFFRTPEDIADTQVVVLDDSPDGPYFDLWSLFAGRKPIRLSELMANNQATADVPGDIIIPLAGASNPLWQNDWHIRDCTTGATLAAFVQRILGFYAIPDDEPARDPNKDIMVTLVDRKASRRLMNQAELLTALRERTSPHVSIQLVDFATLPFTDQIRVARETDVLVGVHGAGLTHMMFLPPGSGAVVEIQPAGLDHLGFRNLAAMRQLSYFRAIADTPPTPDDDELGGSDDGDAAHAGSRRKRGGKRDQWQSNNVTIEAERFLEVVDLAIKSLYSEEPRNGDII